MTTNSSGISGSNTDNYYLSSQRWFGLLVLLLLVWTSIYLVSHSKLGLQGYEYTRFTKSDIRQMNNILATGGPKATPAFAKSLKKLVPNENDGFLDVIDIDSTSDNNPYNTEFGNIHAITEDCDLICRTEKVLTYIRSQYGTDVEDKELNAIARYIQSFNTQETGIFLADYKLKVRSFFWLTGAKVYGEVIFWVIFGVLCSLLFYAGNMSRRRNKDGFTLKEIIFQLAKLFYAPLSAVVLILAYSYFSNSVTLNIDASEGFIVFAFIIGVYSGSFMGLLDNFRRLIFPGNDDKEEEERVVPQYVPVPLTYPEYLKQQLQMQPTEPSPEEAPAKEETKEDKDADTTAPEQAEETSATEQKPKEQPDGNGKHKPKDSIINGDHEIEEVDIDLKLDLSGLFEEEKSELLRLGFSKAIVTLHNVNGKDIIPAKKLNEDTTTFVAYGVRPGIYIARATLSQRLKDEHIINLFGEKTAYVTEDKPGLELYVKKYEAID